MTAAAAADGPREACGVFGLYAPGLAGQAAQLTHLGLSALQHRGQESAGIVVSDGRRMRTEKGMGLVSQVFDAGRLAALGAGALALGHVRYSTTGSSSSGNAQPTLYERDGHALALGHNGNLVDVQALRTRLRRAGAPTASSASSSSFDTASSSDTALLAAALVDRLRGGGPTGPAVAQAMQEVLRGAYSVAVLYREQLVAFRDPHGFKPLCVGELGGGYMVASETCALDAVGAAFLREVEPGEVLVVDRTGLSSTRIPSPRRALCSFEHVYIARPDSRLDGREVSETRREMGRRLAAQAPAEADVVIGVPDSGILPALGYAQGSGLPYAEGLVRNRYADRTFLQPTDTARRAGLRRKLATLPSVLAGNRVVVVDDSLVRGNTMTQLVEMLRAAGAAQVHVRISSPPVTGPCHYGVDLDSSGRLLGAEHTVEQIRAHLGATSLAYLSTAALAASTRRPGGSLCRACFDGDYPLAGSATKYALENPAPVA